MSTIILFVDSFPSVSETFISNKVKQLAQHNMRVVVFCVHYNRKLFATIFADNQHVEVVVLTKVRLLMFLLLHPFTLLRSLLAAKNARQRLFKRFRLTMIKKFKPDILHFEFSGIGVDYLQEIKQLDCKKVVSCRGSAEKVKLLVYDERKDKFRKLLSAVDAVHCVSEDMRRTVIPYCDDPRKIFINYPSIDTNFFSRPPGMTAKTFEPVTILSVGRFTFQKGFTTGLLAAHQLKESGVQFRWVILGNGPEYEEMVYMIAHYQLESIVELPGTRSSEEIKTIMGNADIFFLPSVYEGIANVALEAMSMELPIVATRSGGMEEVIIEEENGLLAEVYDHTTLALHLQRLIRDEALRVRLGKNAANTIRSRFDISIQTARYLKVYSELLRKPISSEKIPVSNKHDATGVGTINRKPLHIGVIVPQFPTISETFFVNKVKGLCQRGHSVTVFGSMKTSNDSLIKQFELDGFDNLRIENLDFKNSLQDFLKIFLFYPITIFKSVHIVPAQFRRRLYVNLCKVATNRHHCDIYHFGYSGTAIFYYQLFDSLKGKTIISCRGTAENVKLVSEKERIRKLKYLFEKVDKIHCVSGSMAATIRMYGAPADKIFINHPAIDTSFFTRASLYKPHERLTIISVGRLVFQKGFMIGLLAIYQLAKKFPSFVWKIAGDGPDMEALMSHVHSLQLQAHVELLGKKNQDEIKSLYEEADIYFLPSVSEGLANAALEAMAMSLPVVSSDVGGMAEAITHNADGKLCSNYDHEAMCSALLELCCDFELRKKIGDAACATAREKFDIKRYIDVFEQIYYSMLE